MQDKKEEVCSCFNEEVVKMAKEQALDDDVVYNIADFFKTFSDYTRIKILYTLLNKEMCVGDLVETLGMSQSAVSHQLRILRQNNLVKFRKKGKAVIYSLDDSHVESILSQGFSHLSHKNKRSFEYE